MVQISGTCGRAITATAGIEVPLTPRVLSPAELEARAWRPAAIWPAPEPPALKPPAAKPATGPAESELENRCECGRGFEKAFGLRVHQRTCDRTPPAPPAEQAGDGNGDQAATGPADAGELRAELADARATIESLRARIEAQGIVITVAAADVRATQSRAEQAEAQLAGAYERIESLLAELAALQVPAPEPVNASPVSSATAGVACDGGCGEKVSAEYVARTGRTWHGPCEARVPAHLQLKSSVRAAA